MSNEADMTPQDPRRYRWAVMLIVIIGTFMAILDSSIVNVALPQIMRAFGVPLDEAKWIVSGYMLAYAVLIPVAGWARDVIGGKFTFLAAMTVFTIGSALCSLAWSNESLIAFRIIQAIGGGAIMPTGLMLITEAFEPEERGTAIGIWGVGVVMAPTVGPVIGGILVDLVGWRSIFYINIPIGIGAVLLGKRLLQEGKTVAKPFDFSGFTALTIFLVSALWGISEGQSEGWTSPSIMAAGSIAIVALTIFFRLEFRVPYPLMDMSLFLIPNFSIAALLAVFRSIALFGTVFMLPVLMQNVMGYTAPAAGLGLAPGAIAIGLAMPVAGRFSDRFGPRIPSFIGVAATALSLYMFSLLAPDSPYSAILWPMIIRGIGIGFLMGPITAAAMNAVPPAKIGMSSGILNLFQQVGGAVGIALLELYIQFRALTHGRLLTTAADTEDVRPQLEAMGILSGDMAGVPTVEVSDMARLAASHAFNDVFLLTAVIMALGLIPALLLQRGKPQRLDDTS